MTTTVRCIVVLAAALVGCGGDDTRAPEIGSVPRLPVAPAAIARACEKAAAPISFRVLCPRRWPTPRGHGAPKARLFAEPADAYLINVENGFTRRGGHVFHLMVGGQAEPFGPWPAAVDPDLRLTTRRVTISEAGGGTFVQQLPARRFASARVHGMRAAVLQGGYLVSVHGERLSRDELVAIAVGMARSTRPR